ncbi:M20/M25/M40 family metallo-hydrolase [Peribacillus glennii]|uniref:M20/M25/M40 family metallo-hydrolase n=1 Tax=Peribacillus glennii TaxID=2303991 RepID=A0A372LGD7_9BACI|nr:M20/M25/M40 family metallo-hydrolase [Peribacillus glennii]RFU65054.1 M20/M25/M40 family metallo-hydrolase [Peribacillus glennii]
MDIKVVHDVIENKKEIFLEDLFRLLKQPSISAQNIGISECVEVLTGLMKAAGIETKVFETPGHPIIYGEVISPKNDVTVLIYGHYDVQPADPIEEWISPPFEPQIRDGKIFARGAGDNKGQLMAHVSAVKALLEAYGELPVNVKMVFDGEEESLSESFAPFVESHKDLLEADVVYTSDGPLHHDGTPMVMLGCRGMLYIELEAEGAKRDNHSGNKGGITPNPAWDLIHLLESMRTDNGNVLIDGFYNDIREPTEFEIDLLKKLPFESKKAAEVIGLPLLEMDGEEYYRKLSLEPTFNISGFTSGYAGEGAKTIIPAKAKAKLDIRLVVDQNPDHIYEKIENHVMNHSPNVKIKCLGKVEPSRTPAQLKIVQTIIRAIGKSYEKEPIVMPAIGATLPDYVFTKLLGLPSVLVPYANADENNHSPNENMDVDCFINGIKASCQVLIELGRDR